MKNSLDKFSVAQRQDLGSETNHIDEMNDTQDVSFMVHLINNAHLFTHAGSLWYY